MSWAKVGMKVVCVNGRKRDPNADMQGYRLDQVFPQEGSVYTIQWIGSYAWADGVSGVGVHLCEFSRAPDRETGIVHPLNIDRFRPLVTKTQSEDVAMFKHIADQVPNMESEHV